MLSLIAEADYDTAKSGGACVMSRSYLLSTIPDVVVIEDGREEQVKYDNYGKTVSGM